MPNQKTKINFMCHKCGKHPNPYANSVELDLSASACHALECANCRTRFLFEDSNDHHFGWLHSGNHSRIVHYAGS